MHLAVLPGFSSGGESLDDGTGAGIACEEAGEGADAGWFPTAGRGKGLLSYASRLIGLECLEELQKDGRGGRAGDMVHLQVP